MLVNLTLQESIYPKKQAHFLMADEAKSVIRHVMYTLLKQRCVFHTILVCNSSLHRAHHFLVCYAYQLNKCM